MAGSQARRRALADFAADQCAVTPKLNCRQAGQAVDGLAAATAPPPARWLVIACARRVVPSASSPFWGSSSSQSGASLAITRASRAPAGLAG